MPRANALTEIVRELSKEHKLEIINFLWLFSHASASAQRAALERITPLFSTDPLGEDEIVRILSEVVAELRAAFNGPQLGRHRF